MRLFFYFVSLLLVLFVTGCATQIQPPETSPNYRVKPWPQRKIALSDQTHWKINGSVSIQSRGKTEMGTFTWEQIDNRYAINIYGPLNLGSIGIAGTPYKVVLNKPTGSYSAATPEALMKQQLGWYLPISNMYYWVRGLPAPGQKGQQQHDNEGHLVFLQQQGWRIRYEAFQTGRDRDLPRKILLDNQQIHVKLVIKNWLMSA